MTREYLYNHLHTIFTGASGALPEYEWADLLLQFSSEIEGGENARTLIISSSHLTFAYDQAGASPSPSSATITATALDTELTPYYDFLVEGISQQNSTSDSYIYTPPISYTLLPQIITVKLREGSSEGTVLAQAQIAIQGTKALSGAITISLSNNACVLPTTTPGGVVTYTGSGTEIRVWEGNVQLSVDNESAPYNAQSFRIGTPVTTNIDCGTITQTYNADHVLVGDMSNMTETTASVEYPIIVTNSAGQETTYYRLQVFSKAIQGQEGSQGLPGEDGITPVVATVSNEICALPADMSGNVSSHVGSGTLIQVFEGSTQLTFTTGTPVAGEFSCGTPTLTPDPSITVGARSASGANCLVGDHSGFLAGVDSVVIGYPLTVVHSNGESFPLTVTQNITKSKQGYTSQYVSVSGEQVFKYSSTESPIPSPTSIILTANLYGGLTTYQWQYYNVGTSLWANLSGTSNTQTYTLTYNQSEWSTATLRIRCVSGDYNDEKTIVKLYDGTDNISLVFSNESFSFPASVSGVIESSGYVGSGTDIHVYQGITELVYDGVETLAGTWKINSTTPTNITVGTPFVDQENYVTVPDHSGVSSSIDNASIEYTITGKDSNGSTFNFSKKQVFTKSKAGADGIDGADGADGADGVNARSVKMTSSAGLVFAYNTEGASPTPSNTTITANTVNTIGDVYYQFFKNDISQGNPSLSNEYVYSPNASLSSMPEKIEVQIREGSAINPILARDQISIMGVRQGQHAITITSTNESHTIPTDSAGTPGSGIYTGSGTKIEVWEGATKLPTDNVSLYANSTFRVAVGTATGITANASPVHNAYDFTIGDHSNMTANIATISYTITVKNSAGIETTYTSLQTFSKSKAGVDSIRYWLESTTASIKKDSGGIFTPTSVTAFAKYQIGEGNATDYAGYWNTYISTDGINEGSPTPVSLNNSASITPSASAKWVRFKLYTDSLRTNLVDQYTVPVVEDGINSITVSLSNEIVSLPSDYSGNVTSYVGSGTTISVFEGSTQLTFTTGTPVAGEFSCGTPTLTPDPSITVGARSASGANCLVAVHSAMSLTVDTAVITYPLSIMRANGETPTFYATQTITKSKPGSSGTWPSEDGLLGYWSFDSINSIPDGPNPIYKKDIFTDTSDFFVYGSNAKIEYIDGHLRFTKAGGANSGFGLNRTLTVGTNIRLRARYVLGSGTPSGYFLQMVNSTFSYRTGTLSLPSDGRWVTVNATVISDTSNVYWYLGTYSATDSYSIEFDFLYLGDGSYLSEIEDDSGNKNKALIIGATPLPGIAKNGIALDGNDDYVQLLPTFNRNYDLNMSVSLWFKIPSTWTWDTAGSHTIFGSSNYGTSGGGIYLNTHTTVNSIFPSIRATTPSFMITATSTSISRDTWYHIVINYSSKVLSYYVNGVLKGSVTNTYSGTFDQPYYLGKGTSNGTPTSQYLACYVDEVRMYMKALTTEEILALYTLKTVSAENKLQESEEEQLLIPTLQLSANSVINKFPDNPAGIIYRSPIGWPVDEDNWEGKDGETVEVVDGELSISKTVASTHRYIGRVSTNPNSKQVILKIKYDSRLYSIAMYNGSAYVVLCLATQMVHEGEYYIASFYNNLPSITNTYFDITLSSSVTDAIVISDIYIGTGANLNRALNEATDNTHLINNGVLPVIEEGKDYLHFNGKTSRLYFDGPLIGAKGTILFDRKRISESIGTNDYIIDDYVPGTSGARVFFDNTGNKLTLAYQNGSGTTQYVFITDSGRTDVINSHLDGFAWGGGFIYAIEDGVLKKGVSGTIVPSTSVFNIGQCGGAYSPGKLYGFLFFNDIILTQKQINTIKYNGLPSPRYIKNTFLLEKAAEDGSMSPQDKAQELTAWLEHWYENDRITSLPSTFSSIDHEGKYKAVATISNTAGIWTPLSSGTLAKTYYDAINAYRAVLFNYTTSGTGFLLTSNRESTTDISALSPSLNELRNSVTKAELALRDEAHKKMSIEAEMRVFASVALLEAATGVRDEEVVTCLGEFYKWDATNSEWDKMTGTVLPLATLQISPNYTPQIPDSPAGTTYRNPPLWATGVDGWASWYGDETVSIVDGRLQSVRTITNNTSVFKAIASLSWKHVIFRLHSQKPITSVVYWNGTGTVTFKRIIKTSNYDWTISEVIPSISYTHLAILVAHSGDPGNTIRLEQVYIGTGAFLTPQLDESGSGNHLANTGVIPGEEDGRKVLLLNGQNSKIVASGPLTGAVFTLLMSMKRGPTSIGTVSRVTEDRTYSTRTTSGYLLCFEADNKLSAYYGNSTEAKLLRSTETYTDATEDIIIGAMSDGSNVYLIDRGVLSAGTAFAIDGSAGSFAVGYSVISGEWTSIKVLGLYLTDKVLTQDEINWYVNNGLPEPRYTMENYLLDKAADDGSMSPADKASELTDWMEHWYEDERITALPTTFASITTAGKYKETATIANTAGIWTPTTASTAAKTYYDASEAYRAVLFNYSTAGTGFLLRVNRNTATDISALSPTLNALRTALAAAETALRDEALRILTRKLNISGATSYGYEGGATTPDPTNLVLTAAATGFTPAAYQWQYYDSGWTNLSNDTGKVAGVTTAELTIYYNATPWGTARYLRVRCLADSAVYQEVTLTKVYDGVDGTSISLKGSVAEPADLADIVSPDVGDLYTCIAGGSYGGVTYAAGDGAAWDGSAWFNAGPIQGPAGTDGASSYLHIKFSAYSDGTGFSDTTNKYIGRAVTTSATAPTDKGDYTWTKWIGDDATSYWIYLSPEVVIQSVAGAYTPSTIVAYAKAQSGSGEPGAYSGRFIVATYDGSTWTDIWTSSGDVPMLGLPSDYWEGALSVRFRLYKAGGTTTLLYEKTCQIVQDGSDAGRYLGRYHAGHPASYNNLDRWTVYDAPSGYTTQPGVWYSDAGTPTRITVAADPEVRCYMAEAIEDVAWAEEQGTYGDSEDYGMETIFQAVFAVTVACETMAATQAFITELKSNLITTNRLEAANINVASLSALTADLGTVTAGVLQSTDWGAGVGMQLDLTNRTIKIGGSTAPKFSVAATGVLSATDAVLSGTLTADSGAVGIAGSLRTVVGTGRVYFYRSNGTSWALMASIRGTLSGTINGLDLSGGTDSDPCTVRTNGGHIYTGGGLIYTNGGYITTNGGYITTSGGHTYTNGGSIYTGGGHINTNGGYINTGGGKYYSFIGATTSTGGIGIRTPISRESGIITVCEAGAQYFVYIYSKTGDGVLHRDKIFGNAFYDPIRVVGSSIVLYALTSGISIEAAGIRLT